MFATVVFGVSTAPFTTWAFSSAGHQSPLVGRTGQPAVVADLATDPLLGVASDVPRRSKLVTVPAGGFLCLYTDGLVERRPVPGVTATEAIDQNTARLATALAEDGDPEMRCIRALSEVVGDHVAEDDIAILIAHISAAATPPE